jgi:hypothetical protein
MALTAVEATAPSYWASYLINGDCSGMEDHEVKACDAWIKRMGMGSPVSCEDAGCFMRWHDAAIECPFAADCQTYTFLVEEEPEIDGDSYCPYPMESDEDGPVVVFVGR